MTVTVNGRAREVPQGTGVAALVDSLSPAPRGVAVALNGEVLPRSDWARTALTEGDVLEVLGAVAGG